VAYLGFGKGGAMVSTQNASLYKEGLGSWNTFCFWTFNGSRKFAHFLWNLLKNDKKRTFWYKVDCKKIFMVGPKGGHRTMAPLNTPLHTW